MVENTRTDPTIGLENPIGDPGWVVGEREIVIQTSELITSWNPCGTISGSPF